VLGTVAILTVLVGLTGCAASRTAARISPPERDLKKLILADQQYSVQTIPPDASAQRAASFRIAAEGHLAFQQGRVDEAENRLERALSLDARNPFCYLYLAEIRFQAGDPEQALMLLDQSEVHFDGHPYWLSEVYTRKGICLEKLRSPEEARRFYRKALEYNPWNETPKKKLEKMESSRG
jgi:tetratricopeptide (TPR) repeat protein